VYFSDDSGETGHFSKVHVAEQRRAQADAMEAAEKKAAAREASVATILVEGSVKLGAVIATAAFKETYAGTNPYLPERQLQPVLSHNNTLAGSSRSEADAMEAAEKKAAAREASVTTILVEGSVKLGAAMIRQTHSATYPYLPERQLQPVFP